MSVPDQTEGQYAHMAAWESTRAWNMTELLWLWDHTQLLFDEDV